jgi:hypothetical protein
LQRTGGIALLSSPRLVNHRGVTPISNVPPFGRLWYGEDAISNAVNYTKFLAAHMML